MNSTDILKSNKTILTLDAGGTNFVFSALENGEEIITPIKKTAVTDNLDKCMKKLRKGFDEVCKKLDKPPVAISFAFPGPADYEHGVIGNLPNFPCFRGGVPLGSYLEEFFNIPVFINNDGNLFAYGEAIGGALPYINGKLKEMGSNKQYQNLLGLTFGTGFGGGVVINQQLLLGDNGAGGDVWVFRHKKFPQLICEESVSVRAIKRVYAEYSNEDSSELTPNDIYNIAEGIRKGNREAALKSFEELGEVAANTVAQALTIVDGLVVLGGGIADAAKYFMPSFMKEMNGEIGKFSGEIFPRLQMKAYNLQNKEDFESFAQDNTATLKTPYNANPVRYNAEKKTGIIVSRLGTNKAVALGAYAFAINKLENYK
jgi:glucokinase